MLHFHEPFVPFLSLGPAARVRASTSPRSTPTPAGARPVRVGKRALQRLRSTGCTAASRSARRPATSSTATSRATTRSSPTASTCAASGRAAVRALARRDANILFIGRFENRKGAHLPAQGVPDPAASRAIDCRLLVVGAGPQEREMRRYIATRRLTGRGAAGPRQRRRQGALLRHGRCVRVARHRPGVVRHRAARGDGGGHAHRLQRHPRLQGRRAARRAGAARAAARHAGARRRDRHACSATRRCARGWARPAGNAPPVRLGEHHRQGGRLLRLRHPPARGPGSPAGRVPRASATGADPAGPRRPVLPPPPEIVRAG